MAELLIGGLGASTACLFTNPLEVVKTRVQLQGELKSRGKYHVHYRNVFHAFYAIGKNEGLLALQKGLVPALFYQLSMNGIRLGTFQCINNLQLTKDAKGETVFVRTVVAGSAASVVGAVVGSPFYLVKTHLQAKSNIANPVGHQHDHESMSRAFANIIKTEGFKGLWRGASASILRVTVGGTVQLTTFTTLKETLGKYEVAQQTDWINTLVSATVGGASVTACMTPFDVVATRMYNQPVDQITRKGLLYDHVLDCAVKIFKTEGISGFYKGWSAALLRIGPHSILSLFFWQEIRKYYLTLV